MKKKLQIFISSTFMDLKIERQAAVEAILKSGNIPAGMELFTSGNKSQLITIKKWIDESDIFLLILGGRYGSIEPDSGKSYTEVEYDYATSIKKPLFSIVIKDEYLAKKKDKVGSSVIEIDNPQKLIAFRKKVTLKMTSFFGQSRDIKLAIHETIREFKEGDEFEFSGWVPGTEVEIMNELLDENIKYDKEIKELKKKLLSMQRLKNKIKLPEEDEKKYIQNQIDEVKLYIRDFAFTTRYNESQNTLLAYKDKIFVNNRSGNAFRIFIIHTTKILDNCIKSQGFHPLDNYAFNRVFPSGYMTIVSDIKKIIIKSIHTIDFTINSNSYKQNDRITLSSLGNLKDDIQEDLLKHEEILIKITDDLFPKMIQRCKEVKTTPINNLTTFLDGLIEIKNRFVELKKIY